MNEPRVVLHVLFGLLVTAGLQLSGCEAKDPAEDGAADGPRLLADGTPRGDGGGERGPPADAADGSSSGRCGNGVLDEGEQCEEGACCDEHCRFAGQKVCRPGNGVCDPEERCSGTSADCPGDSFAARGTECRGGSCECGLCQPSVNLLENGGMEKANAALPHGWSASGLVPVDFYRVESAANAHQGQAYFRLAPPGASSGTVWAASPLVYCSEREFLHMDAYLRSNLKNVRLEIHEYDQLGKELGVIAGPAYQPGAWQWDRYQERVGCFNSPLHADTRTVIVTIAGDITSSPAYLDIDDVIVRGMARERVVRRYGVHSAMEYDAVTGIDVPSHASLLENSLGIEAARNGVNWWMIEPTQGARDWSQVDTFLDALVARGIEPLMVFVGSPGWANGKNDDQFYIPQTEPEFTNWVNLYRVFARDTVLRYKGRVSHWELWNEPNAANFWAPVPNPVQYARWAQAMAAEISGVDPAAEVAFGSLAWPDVPASADQHVAGQTFVQVLYDQGVYPGVISVHPYHHPANNEPPATFSPGDGINTFRDIETLRAVMLKNGQGASNVWITEFGWSIADPQMDINEDRQRSYLTEALSLVQGWPYVTRVFWFWDWDRVPLSSPLYGYGLLRKDQSVRPAGFAFTQFLATPR